MAAGVAWHRLIQQVSWIEALPKRDALIQSLSDLLAEPSLRTELADKFLERLEAGELADWLTEAKYRDQVLARHYSGGKTLHEPLRLDVRREMPFVVEIEGQWLEGQIDRLVLISEGDQVVAAELLDFKTGEVRVEELTEESQRYADQMHWYARAVEQLFSLPKESVGLFLGFTSVRCAGGAMESRVLPLAMRQETN